METMAMELRTRTWRDWLNIFVLLFWTAGLVACSIYGLVIDNTTLIFCGLIGLLVVISILQSQRISKLEKLAK